MDSAPAQIQIVATGFWIPIGRSNFFDAERDSVLVSKFNGYRNPRQEPLDGHKLSGEDLGARRLNATVYRRLLTVLSSGFANQSEGRDSNRYSSAFPMYNSERLNQINATTDPDTVALVCSKDDLVGEEWAKVAHLMEGLVLVVVSEGFYVWLALYSEPRDSEIPSQSAVDVSEALREHIYNVVGGSFFNHSSGREGTPLYVADPNALTLRDYRDKDLGIFPFFQINLILEGMYNAMLDPRAFFDNSTSRERSDTVKAKYSIGNFIRFISATAQIDPEQTGDGQKLVDDLWQFLHLPDNLSAQEYFDLFKRIRVNCLNPWVRRDLLRQFLKETTNVSLNLLKLRLESCSRALLAIMIKLAHSRHPFIQAEVPPTLHVANPVQDQYVIPAGANEGQLRSYIILIAAKLPLLESVEHYLQNTITRLQELNADLSEEYANSIWRSIAGLRSARAALIESLKDHLDGLNDALEQAYMDRMVAETEKLRAEQETLSEIERIRQRTNQTLSPANDNSVDTLANVLAVAGVLIAIILGSEQLKNLVNVFGQFLSGVGKSGPGALVPDVLFTIFAIIVVSALAIGAYVALHFITYFIVSRLTLRRQQKQLRDEQYYYEMDLRLDADMDESYSEGSIVSQTPEALLQGDFTQPLYAPQWRAMPWKDRRQHPFVDRREKYKPERNSYRVNRSGSDEAQHKVYVMANIYWPGPSERQPWVKAALRLRIFLVYEALFHSPSDQPSFVFKTFRMVSTTSKVLTPEQIDDLKRLVVSEFVNRWITSESARVDPSNDALMSLHGQGRADADNRLASLV